MVPRAVRGQVGNPARFQQAVDHRHQPILHEMRAIQQDHAGLPFPGGLNTRGGLTNDFQGCRRAGWGRRGGVAENLMKLAETAALGQRKYFNPRSGVGRVRCIHGGVNKLGR
jgi:hypothetical protein